MRKLLTVLAPALCAIATATAAWAQDGSSPPQPNLNKSAPAWLGFLVMVILLALVLGVSLLPSKRGHQD